MTRYRLIALALLGLAAVSRPGMSAAQEPVFEQLLMRERPHADVRIAYDAGPRQFAELWLPKREDPAPVVILIHGGCWHAQLPALDFMNHAAQALRARGYAVWNVEYRRVGEQGGGYPGTFVDVAHGADFLRSIADRYRLDLGTVIAMGHSAGSTLAHWLAGRHRLPTGGALYAPDPIAITGVVNLAGPGDLKQFASIAAPVCRSGTLQQVVGAHARPGVDPYEDTSPAELLPLGVPQVLVYGEKDLAVPPLLGEWYRERATRSGDRVELIVIPETGHFDVIAPWMPAWTTVIEAVDRLARSSGLAKSWTGDIVE